ncbi:MAG: rhodanese-like domain-containing protein [Thiobacillaceae bacterium]|jgi:rhodanese-related sulfurtransferase
MRHVSVAELATMLKEGKHPVLLDVREAWEIRLAPFPGMTWIPMGQISERLEELNKTEETVVICHHGIRSWRVAKYLENAGFANVINLTGGIDAWSKEIDPAIPLY